MSTPYPDIEGQLYTTGAPDAPYTEAEARQRAASNREAAAAASAAGASALVDAKAYTDGKVAGMEPRVAAAERGAADAASSAAAIHGDLKPRVESIEDRQTALESAEGFGPSTPEDGQTASLLSQPGSLTRAATISAARTTLFDVPAPTGTADGDRAAVLAACQAAVDAGRMDVTLGPGLYQLDGLTVKDVLGRYLVGDGVTFTPGSWVFPFTSTDLVTLSGQRGASSSRARAAIEVDDALPEHWTHLFPETKRLGITVGTAWHTGNEAKWIAEAHRHGWEVIHHLPENITATTYLSAGTLEDAIRQGLDKIEAEIGTRKGIGFVYPQHVRSPETDRVLSKYFTRARGLAEHRVYPRGAGHTWLVASSPLDPQFSEAGISDLLRQRLRDLASAGGDQVFYMHLNAVDWAAKLGGLRAFVAECRRLGIEIVNPGQIWAERNIVPDPYLEDTGQWSLKGVAQWDTTTAYHGARSVLVSTPTATNFGSLTTSHIIGLGTTPGMFRVYRASIRYKADAPVTVSSVGQGIGVNVAATHRRMDASRASAPNAFAGILAPTSGTTLPAADWGRVQTLVHLPPSAETATLQWIAQNVSGVLWLDEARFEHMDDVPEVTYEGTLVGTGNAIVRTNVPDLARCSITLQPLTAPKGTVTYRISGSSNIILTSTSAEDAGAVRVTIRPGGSYVAEGLSSEGA